ncbi:response regulator transcription factor [Microbulbifer sp. 2205BS26-8]|uniref:response regulator transcription factor n=1 Tax=Microbulbifer sp. 2205BS26-8 TaxID=3064386 RepID=UPI00273E6326|nr:response regulator transcription factor [Microbulbifer sp. 2205BS26-8]MDP5208721.1 response regulator transcription factor [Microbulbifer sp. 2205BS26-8]
MSKRILIIEDDHDILRLLRMHLEALGYLVTSCDNGEQGLMRALNQKFNLLVLDVMLPGLDGLEVCRRLRDAGNALPILMLTARSSELDRVLGLEMGADDYLPKPFGIRELQARVKALLRRTALNAQVENRVDRMITCGRLHIDCTKRLATLDLRSLELTAREFDLLCYLASHPGRVFRRAQILDAVWGYQHSGYEHTVNSHINRLRSKLERNPSQPEYVLTVWGVGYKFNDAVSA